jgi:hypothetical protein
MRHTLLATALAVPLLLFGNSPSMAQVDVDIDVNPFGYGYQDYDDDDYPYRRRGRLSCYDAKQLVRDRGYRRVITIECQGRVYTFEGSRRGNRFLVSVNSRTGAVWRR